MNDLPVKIPLKCEWSYTWNKSINAKDSCPAKLIKSLVALLCALFCTHTVSKTEAYSVYDNHRESTFGKKYFKLYDRKIDAPDDTHSNEKNGVPEKTQEKIAAAEPTSSNNSAEEEPNTMPKNITASEPNTMPENITASEPNTMPENITASKPNTIPENITASKPNEMPTRCCSPHDFRCLMRTGQFSENTRYIVTGHLDLTKTERTIAMPRHFTVQGRTYANDNPTARRVDNILMGASLATRLFFW